MLIDGKVLISNENCDMMETVTVSMETAKRLADHHLALAQYWRQVARLPPVLTAAGQRKIAERQHR